MKQELQKILSNWDYSKGLDWFNQHVQGKFFLKQLFAKSSDTYNNQKLRQELNDILNSLPDQVLISTPKESKTKPKEEKPILDLPKASKEALTQPKIVERAAGSPEELQLDQEWKPLYREAMYRRSQLKEEMTDEERKVLAYEVLDLMDQVQAIWERKDFLIKYGHLPDFESKGIESMTITQMHKRITTLRTYISKAKKGILKVDKVPAWEAEIKDLERAVKG